MSYRERMSDLGPPSRPRRPSRFDVLVAAFFTTVVVIESFTEVTVMSQTVHAAVAATAMVAMTWRRVHPLAVAFVVAAAFAVLSANGGGLSVALGLLIVSFTLGSETSGRRSHVGAALLATVVVVGFVFDLEGPWVGDIAAAATLVAGPWFAGRTLRQRAVTAAEAISRADRAELERRHEVERATAQERVRLARELHDVVSHSISVIVISAQAVRRRLHPEQRREIEDLEALETTAREAMAEMRRLFGVLREGEGATLSPQPGLGDLPRLVASAQAGGVEVRLVTSGDTRPLSPGLDLTAYRIAQEALTNALRHADASEIVVRVAHRPTEVEVCVEDDGSGLVRGAARGADLDGNGLRGMRERADLYGGTLEVGPRSPRGTRVHATLPVGAGR